MNMAEQSNQDLESDDFRGRTVLVSTHVVARLEQIREGLREHMVEHGGGLFKVNGFVLGKVVDVSVHGQYWIQFEWNDSPVQVRREAVLKILLDDEGEPDEFNGLPRLVS